MKRLVAFSLVFLLIGCETVRMRYDSVVDVDGKVVQV